MQVLIVESDPVLADRWFDELSAAGCDVHVASSAQQAIRVMDACTVAVIVLDLELTAGGALSVPIYAGYRLPDARVIVVTGSTVFNDGSIFDLCANACAYLNSASRPGDLAALVDYHGQRGAQVSRARVAH
jgi:DNA-binding response OmpR family regulator